MALSRVTRWIPAYEPVPEDEQHEGLLVPADNTSSDYGMYLLFTVVFIILAWLVISFRAILMQMIRDFMTVVTTSRDYEMSIEYHFRLAGNDVSLVHVTIAGEADLPAMNYDENSISSSDLGQDDRVVEPDGDTSSRSEYHDAE